MNKLLALLFLLSTTLSAQVTYEEVKDPENKIRGKYESYTAINGKTYQVGDLFVLQYATNGMYLSIFSPGLMPTYAKESPNEVVKVEKFKGQHIMGTGIMYAMVVGDNNKNYQIAIDAALETKEIKEYNQGVTVESVYDEMDETTTFQTSSLTIADGTMPYLDFDIKKMGNGKFYLRAYYRSSYRLAACFRQNDPIKIKTDTNGIIELTNVMNTECGNSGIVAYEVPKNILEKLANSKWTLMRLYNSEPFLEYRPDGNEDYFAQLANAILNY